MAEKYLGYITDRIPSNDESKGDNAILKVVAIKENGSYRKLSSEEAKQYCSPNGRVFGPCFFNNQNNDFYEGIFIEFEIQLGKKKETKSFNETDYIINYTPRPKAINLPRLVTYNGKIKSIVAKGYLSPDEVNITVDKSNIFGKKNAKFFLYDSVGQQAIGIFKYQSSSDSIESNYGKNVQEFLITPERVVADKDGKSYLLFNEQQNTLARGSIIDFMTNQQLADWLKTKMKDIASIDKNTLSLICELAESHSAEDDRDASRFERLKEKSDAFELNIQTLIELICTHPKYFSQFVDNIDLIEKEVKDNFEKKYIADASETIKGNQEKIQTLEEKILQLEDTLKTEKEKIAFELKKTKEKLEKENASLTKQVEEKSNRLKTVNENYDSVVATISVLSPVLSTPSKTVISEDNLDISKVDFPKDENARSYSQIKDEDDESFISFMKRHVCFKDEKLEEYLKQVKKVFAHKGCFIPNTAVAYLFAKALRNTEVMIMHVEHDWLHYSDFVKHGLLEAFRTANENKSKNFILVLDGLNVTQPECGLRPLLNLINGDVPILEGCGFAFPNNMTVMATLVSSSDEHAVGLKLSSAYFRKWFAVGDPAEETDRIHLPENFWVDEVGEDYGYAEPSDLPKEAIIEKSDFLEKYLNF